MSAGETPLMGRLGKGRLGASMPVDAPYYQSPPFYYRDAVSMSIAYLFFCKRNVLGMLACKSFHCNGMGRAD